ncbi:hypothetical protein L1887_41832 [Cichorium endivia]|nr:hypothetical protein L1887_41832 [Cichorium endivia]
MEINVSRKQIQKEQTQREKRIRELLLGWWIEIELITELFGFVEPIGGFSFGSAVTVLLTTLVNSSTYQSYLFNKARDNVSCIPPSY